MKQLYKFPNVINCLVCIVIQDDPFGKGPSDSKTMKYGEIYVAVMINTPNLLDDHISAACSALDLVENTGYKVLHFL